MYPDSEFARPVSSFRRPAPVLDIDPDVQPDKTVCFRSEWTPYIVGALRQLLLQTTWATTDPDQLNLMQARAQLLIALFMEGCPPEQNTDGLEFDGEELMPSLCESLRFENGKLQAWCCGEWTDIGGQPAQGIGGPGQPGSGAEQPASGGGQACYNAQLQANGTWLLPTVVNSGDTISLTNATGAGQDGTVSPWRCPNGQSFFAGQCIGAGGPQAGDPLITVDHMKLIFNVNGTYYDAMNGPVTIPGGVVNAQVTVQVNDGTLTDNSGSYAFQVCATNNAVSNWSHCWLGGKHAVGLQLPPQTQIWGSYDFTNDRIASQDSGAGTAQNASVDIPFVGDITSVEFDVLYDNDGPLGSAGTGIATDANNPGVQNLHSVLTPVGTGTLHVHWTGSAHISLRLRLFASSIKTTVGSTKITNIRVNGTGVSPVGSNNC